MATTASRLDRQVQFLRRASLADALLAPQTARGGFLPLGQWLWAEFRPGRPRELSVAGMSLQGSGGTLSIHDSDWARTLTAADRLIMEGVEYEIEMPPRADGGMLRLEIAQVADMSAYAREMEQRGEIVILRRLPGTDVPARAIVTGYSPEEIASGIEVGERKVILMAQDLEGSAVPFPRRGDRIVARGKTFAVLDVDDSTHRGANGLSAYELRVSGAA